MPTSQLAAPSTRSVVLHDTVSEALIEQVREDGYGVLRNALSAAEVAEINAEAVRLCRGELGEIGQGPQTSVDESDADVLRRYLCIHHPHKLSDVVVRSLSSPRIVDALTSVIGPNVKSMQSMLFIKAEGRPGQPWHQDEYFIPTRDRSLTAVWIALDDATVENGCLWVLPGSHRRGVLYPDREQDDPRFDCSIEAYDFPYTDADAVPVEIPAGAAVIFSGYLLHRSLPNSGRHGYRRALAHHYMSAESPLGWKVPPDTSPAHWDFRDVVLVAGEDPYAYKGITDVTRAYVRPDKEGGCDR
ncbi:phytanoyl-CoA dioxygenase family protein [Plantactinospora soyae]|uniref:Ectoine hydroxylase-related dioxygenase (Phytanoyl-CoA dioxygenase family) n=1 Tax=Plantactinospora soyae TaxID=1544732 RepID=A0A927M833_9ACTN|nr:phytanoyl-CoA dioxygenase family protein [Plantactinospora soyae]MBE1489699.1 ectoine hydroxylase-related dioxygenase (phytanoyl-CoA dioxygenase family) [Plantactinospora soyae]